MKTSIYAVLLLMLIATSPAGSADAIYRCQGPAQAPVYSDHVCGPHARRIEVPPPAATAIAPPVEHQNTTSPPAVSVNNQNNVNITQAAPPPPASRPNRGLPFSDYRLLDSGMSEGRVLAIAGPPDRETVDSVNTRDGIQRKSYYYFSHGYNASVTRIQFVNGRVRSLQRTPILPH